MPGIGHVGVGLAAKRMAPEVPVGVLLAASEATDLLWGALELARSVGVECGETWSHSLATSAALSVIGGATAARRYRRPRAGVTVGLVIFSHWALDFVAWKDTLTLLYEGSRRVGLGLYDLAGIDKARFGGSADTSAVNEAAPAGSSFRDPVPGESRCVDRPAGDPRHGGRALARLAVWAIELGLPILGGLVYLGARKSYR